ncbi:MAG: type III-B CRISPR module RAMP protein Cmr6 [Bacteroidota bacterium]
MNISNPSHYFYLKNGSDLDEYERQNEFVSAVLSEFSTPFFELPNVTNKFNLTFKYNGLLVGSGYLHPKIDEQDFQLGFYFDFTSGLPTIPGTSIKGVLKKYFPFKAESDKILRMKSCYIFDSFNKINQIRNDNVSPLFSLIKNELLDPKLLDEIFFKDRQIFFDAFVVGIHNGKLFEEDHITSHKAGKFKAPNPVKFLKVAPGTSFRFQFKLTNYSQNGINISASQKENLFKKILRDFGIGAKRNVGYGQFTAV